MKTINLVLGFCLALLWGCGQNKSKMSTDPGQEKLQFNDSIAMKVFVSRRGIISANRKIVSLVALDSMMFELKSKNGIVYYSRDHVTGEPPPESMNVMNLVVKHELPVKFFTDSTFTEFIRPE